MVRREDGDGTIAAGGAVDEPVGAALDAELGCRPAAASSGDMADIAALAEHTRGAAAGIDDLVYLHGDIGISAGIITGGRLVTGHGGRSGKVGHMVVNPAGPRCGCGSRGCWETEIGEAALLRHAGAGTGPGSSSTVVRAAAHGDRAARDAVRTGRGLARLRRRQPGQRLQPGHRGLRRHPARAVRRRRRRVRSRLDTHRPAGLPRARAAAGRDPRRRRRPDRRRRAGLRHLLADPLDAATA